MSDEMMFDAMYDNVHSPSMRIKDQNRRQATPYELHEGMKDYSQACRCGERFVIHPTGKCKNCLLAGLRFRK